MAEEMTVAEKQNILLFVLVDILGETIKHIGYALAADVFDEFGMTDKQKMIIVRSSMALYQMEIEDFNEGLQDAVLENRTKALIAM